MNDFRPERALVIVAHPDDAEFLCGGTVARLADQGCEIYYLLATSGDKGTKDESLTPQALAAIREREQRAAAATLGVRECFFLGYPDGELEETLELRGQFVRFIRSLQPNVLLTWDGFRNGFNHRDHRVVGRVARDAVFPAAHDPLYHPELRELGLAPHRIDELWLFGADEPDHHVDIEPYLERKVDALLAHESQMRGRTREDLLRLFRERAKDVKRRTGFRFAESFRRIDNRQRPPGQPPGAMTRGRTRRPAAART
ncbi:MAG TPA: PIG-L deacetylase family protein [Dehalococcoidia bacterium]|nr:PIG-L deacetylase family protein [Dehalococcoidia bacterium]